MLTGVFRNGNKVTVKLVSQAPAYSLREFKLKKGDEVTIILTNLDKVEDLTHGFAIPKYDINFIVNPQETKSVTFKADKPGVYWCYCTHFCHALHLEMRTRMIVEKLSAPRSTSINEEVFGEALASPRFSLGAARPAHSKFFWLDSA